jgi:hypothetical protein
MRFLFRTYQCSRSVNRKESRTKGDSVLTGVDWKAAPRTAQWWAVDGNMQAHWFMAPNIAPFTDFWFTDHVPAPLFGYEGDWRESLTGRPK